MLKPKICEDVIWRKDGLKNEITTIASHKKGPIRFLNPVGGKIIELSNGTNTIRNIIDNISTTFEETNLEEVEKDVDSFLRNLKKIKIIDF
jgi:hypothetical protein